MFGAKLSWCQIVRCQIVRVPNCPVPNCPGAKLSTFIILVPNYPLLLSWCQIVRFIISVPNCPVPNCPVPNCPVLNCPTIVSFSLLWDRKWANWPPGTLGSDGHWLEREGQPGDLGKGQQENRGEISVRICYQNSDLYHQVPTGITL